MKKILGVLVLVGVVACAVIFSQNVAQANPSGSSGESSEASNLTEPRSGDRSLERSGRGVLLPGVSDESPTPKDAGVLADARQGPQRDSRGDLTDVREDDQQPANGRGSLESGSDPAVVPRPGPVRIDRGALKDGSVDVPPTGSTVVDSGELGDGTADVPPARPVLDSRGLLADGSVPADLPPARPVLDSRGLLDDGSVPADVPPAESKLDSRGLLLGGLAQAGTSGDDPDKPAGDRGGLQTGETPSGEDPDKLAGDRGGLQTGETPSGDDPDKPADDRGGLQTGETPLGDDPDKPVTPTPVARPAAGGTGTVTLGSDCPDRIGWTNPTVTYGNNRGTVGWSRTSGFGSRACNKVTTGTASDDELSLIESMSE